MANVITQNEFVEQNPTVKNWLEELARKSKDTAIQYGCQFYNYWLWLKEKEYANVEQLLGEYKQLKGRGEEWKHIELIKAYIFEKKAYKSQGNRDMVVYSVRSWYKYNRCELPREKIDTSITEFDRQRLREKLSLKPMTLEDFRILISPMKVREKAVMLTLLQSGMGVGEFCHQFNVCTCREEWLRNGNGHVCEPVKVMKQLREGKPLIKIELVGRKSNPRPYHTYIGRDAIEELKRYLKFRSELIQNARERSKELEELETTGGYMKEDEKKTLKRYKKLLPHLTPEWTHGEPIFISNFLNPIGTANIESFVREYKKVTGLSDKQFTPHNCRDLFKTECSHRGVRDIISEFWYGHSLDAYGYNQLDRLYPEDFEREYLKVEESLNILSHVLPKAEVEKAREENRKLKERLGMLENVVKQLVTKPQPSEEEKQRLIEMMLSSREDEETPYPNSNGLRLPK